VQRGHGDATKLIMEGVDLGKVTALIDEVVANGGVGERAMREDSVRRTTSRWPIYSGSSMRSSP
jgi:hypothetical protein